MSVKLIKEVENKKEKENTYRNQLGRYKFAMRQGFYFEAMMIVYSLLEDRMISFLYYCGIFKSRNSLKLNNKIRQEVTKIVYKDKVPKKIIFRNITTKLLFSKEIVLWSQNITGDEIKDSKYLMALKNQIEDVDADGLIAVIDSLENQENGWLKYRNEIIHASMNKNLDSLYEKIEKQTIEGMEYARFIDSQVKVIKKNNKVRKALKLQNN